MSWWLKGQPKGSRNGDRGARQERDAATGVCEDVGSEVSTSGAPLYLIVEKVYRGQVGEGAERSRRQLLDLVGKEEDFL